VVLLGIFILPVAGVFIVTATDPRDPDNPENSSLFQTGVLVLYDGR
jgi:hypothetical protein